MASKIKVDQIEGSTGSTITVPTGQTFTVTDGLAIGSLPTVTVAKGGTNLTSFTAGDVLYATGSTTLAKLPKGSGSQTLKMNSGATAPEWATVAAASGDCVKLYHEEKVDVDLDVVQAANIFTTDYQVYKIFVSRLTGPQYAKFAFLVDTTTQTGTYITKWNSADNNTTTGANAGQNGQNLTTGAYMQSTMGIQNAIGDNSGRTSSWEITVWNPLSTDLMTAAFITAAGSGDNTYWLMRNTAVMYQSLTAIDGIEIVGHTDNITNCQMSIYGFKV